MSPDAVAPAWQPLLSLLSPTLLALIPLVGLLSEALLRLPLVSRLRDIGFLVSIFVGIAVTQGQAVLENGAACWTLAAVLHGTLLGAMASIGYKGVHEAEKKIRGPRKARP